MKGELTGKIVRIRNFPMSVSDIPYVSPSPYILLIICLALIPPLRARTSDLFIFPGWGQQSYVLQCLEHSAIVLFANLTFPLCHTVISIHN